jgi:pyruvate/2-oxoglutarate dehydrogenase complex dihydrolipoamide acyltransferase (E2) component
VPVEVVMPKLGLTMASGTIARWIKQPGEAVREGEPLLEVSTDKINYEVESPASGTVARALGTDGEEFACGSVIGLIALAGESNASAAPARPPAAERVLASPAARRLARERDVPLAMLRGTGPRGRITLADIPAAALAPQPPPERRAIYRKMTEVGALPVAQVETVAHVGAVRALIERRRDFRWTAYAVFAVARLLRDHPVIRTDATSGAPFERIDIGVAADTPSGLIVPVVRGADALPLAAIEAEIVRLAELARTNALRGGDVGGACFSISNVGPQGIERVSPLPDPPQTAILGIGAATQRPAVVDGALVPAWMMTCVVSFDHRYIDGAPAARFLADLTRAFADPGVLL